MPALSDVLQQTFDTAKRSSGTPLSSAPRPGGMRLRAIGARDRGIARIGHASADDARLRPAVFARRALLPRRAAVVPRAALVSPELARAVAAPILATAQLALRDPNLILGLSAICGAGAMELARGQTKERRVACAALGAAAPAAMHLAVTALIGAWRIDVARVPVQAVLDTAMASIAGTTVALFSTLMRPPWAGDSASAPIEGPVASIIARFVVAAALGPVLFHTVMAAAVPPALRLAVQVFALAINPAFVIARNL